MIVRVRGHFCGWQRPRRRRWRLGVAHLRPKWAALAALARLGNRNALIKCNSQPSESNLFKWPTQMQPRRLGARRGPLGRLLSARIDSSVVAMIYGARARARCRCRPRSGRHLRALQVGRTRGVEIAGGGGAGGLVAPMDTRPAS